MILNRRRSDPPTVPTLVENIYAVRATMADGSSVDLLLFADHSQAEKYRAQFRPLPLGFDSLDVVPRRVIGAVVDRRCAVGL